MLAVLEASKREAEAVDQLSSLFPALPQSELRACLDRHASDPHAWDPHASGRGVAVGGAATQCVAIRGVTIQSA